MRLRDNIELKAEDEIQHRKVQTNRHGKLTLTFHLRMDTTDRNSGRYFVNLSPSKVQSSTKEGQIKHL